MTSIFLVHHIICYLSKLSTDVLNISAIKNIVDLSSNFLKNPSRVLFAIANRNPDKVEKFVYLFSFYFYNIDEYLFLSFLYFEKITFCFQWHFISFFS